VNRGGVVQPVVNGGRGDDEGREGLGRKGGGKERREL